MPKIFADFGFTKEALDILSHMPEEKADLFAEFFTESLEAGADIADISCYIENNRDFFINELFAEEKKEQG